ncbi:adenosine kinase [Agarilytica rhodophyticola]|uniref:adenosine kinase n=1 Tax=Agarilytica rhodophyticola TaxID=1737490 RepID=UPI000B348DB1|nr:adenosine kinase [Agarilytica rhodophyticola]
MNTYDIYGIGAALLDTEIEVTDADLQQFNIEKGLMTLVDDTRQKELMNHLKDHLVASKKASGGSGANTIIAASSFGSRTFYSCKVANDENGLLYLSDLEKANVTYHANNGSSPGVTGKCLVMITSDAERTMNTYLGISETVSVIDIDEDALKQSKYVYIEGYQVTSPTGRPAAIKLKELADANNIKTSISLSDPAIVNHFHDGLKEMIGSGVDILFCNKDEAINFTQADSFDDAFEGLKKYAKTFAITMGAEGSCLFDGEQRIDIAPCVVKAIDTNGAGDMYAGAFLYALSQGKTYQQAGNLASKAASVIVSQYGPRLRKEQHAEVLSEMEGF